MVTEAPKFTLPPPAFPEDPSSPSARQIALAAAVVEARRANEASRLSDLSVRTPVSSRRGTPQGPAVPSQRHTPRHSRDGGSPAVPSPALPVAETPTAVGARTTPCRQPPSEPATERRLRRQCTEMEDEVRDLRQEIASLRRTVDDQSETITKERRRTADAERRADAAEAARRNAECTSTEHVKHREAVERRASDLTEQLEGRVGELERLLRAMRAKEEEVGLLRERAKQHAQKQGDAEARVRAVEQQLRESREREVYLESRLAATSAETEGKTERCDQMARERAAATQLIEKLRKDIEDCKADYENAQAELSSMRQRHRETCDQHRRHREHAKQEAASLRVKIGQLTSKTQGAEERTSDLAAQIREQEDCNSRVEARLAESKRQLADMSNELLRARSEKESAETLMASVRQECDAAVAEAQSLRQHCASARADAQRHRDEVTAAVIAAREVEKQCDDSRQQHNDAQGRVAALSERCDSLGAVIADRDRNAVHMERELCQAKERCEVLAGQLAHLQDKAAASDAEALSARAEADALRRTASKYSEVSQECAAARKAASDSQQQLSDAQQSLRSLQIAHQEASTAAQLAEQKIGPLEACRNEQEVALRSVVQRADHSEEAARNHARELVRVQGLLEKAEARVTVLLESENVLNDRVAAAEDERGHLRNVCERLRRDRSDLQQRVTELQGMLEHGSEWQRTDAAALREEANRARADAETARQEAAAKRGEILRLRSTLARLEGKLQSRRVVHGSAEEPLSAYEVVSTQPAVGVVQDINSRDFSPPPLRPSDPFLCRRPLPYGGSPLRRVGAATIPGTGPPPPPPPPPPLPQQAATMERSDLVVSQVRTARAYAQ